MKQINLLRKRPIWLRTDILSFIVIYLGLLPLIYTTLPIEEIYIKFFFVVLFFFNCLFFFVCETNQKYKAQHRFIDTKNIEEATHINFVERERSGRVSHQVELLERIVVKLESGKDEPVTFFYHRKLKFYYDSEEKKFRKIKPLLHQQIEDYLQRRPRFFNNEIERILMDRNNLKFPLPDFMQIFKEQIMDPLNFFQIFSVMLWFFDDNFYHPLMMIFLLLISNLSVVFQRISTIVNLRSLQMKPYTVQVLDKNSGSFAKKSSESLFPGDIIVLQRTKELTYFDNSAEANSNDFDEIRKMIPFGDKIPEDFLRRIIFKGAQGTQPGAVPTQEPQSQLSNSVDLLMLEGSAAVDESILTGESLPQIKDPLDKRFNDQVFNKKQFKSTIIYAGTDVLQASADNGKKPLGMVLNTGFYTTKGRLARTVLFNDENNSVSQKEAYLLLFLLLIVSIVSSIYVLLAGLAEEGRNKDKLFIRCILIVTTVVPPELPMIMAMAVNASVLYLRRKRIFCTEPFRIPLAGKITTCVFDKTGTLTKESLLLKGFVYPLQSESPSDDKLSASSINKEVAFETNLKNEASPVFDRMSAVMGGCHTIIEVDKVLQGDPIELLFFSNSDFRFNASAKQTVYAKNTMRTLTIKRIFAFSSELKRMSAIVRLNGFGSLPNGDYLVSKGAPEIMMNFLKNADKRYDAWLSHFAAEGFRLLSMTIKPLTEEESRSDDRALLEKDLEFIGFLILENELKHDSKFYIQRIKQAERDVVILTGDHLLTSMKTFQNLVSSSVEVNSSNPNMLSEAENKFAILSYDAEGHRELKDQNGVPFSEKPTEGSFVTLKRSGYVVGITGEHVDTLTTKDRAALHFVDVVARVSPKQKEAYVVSLRRTKQVLMCGDGTNDVGALKAADIGIALVGTKNEVTHEEKLAKKKKREEAMRKALMERRMPRADEITTDDGEPEFKLGDASIAAPFTNKHSNSIKCVETILKQGVATLTCGMQSYKIVTLSSLLTAYSLSTLHLENLKFSDMQNTVMGIYGAYLYFQLSNGKPTKQLSKERPPKSIFNIFFWLSLAGQLMLQLVFTYLILQFARARTPEEQKEVDNEDEFIPTFMNSVMFMFNLASMFCISVFNYEGRPFMVSLSENKKHFKFLVAPLGLILVLVFDLSETVSEFFQMSLKSPLPGTDVQLFMILFGFVGLTYLWTTLVKYLHLGKIEKWI